MNFQAELQFFVEYLGEQISSPFGDLPGDGGEERQKEMNRTKRKPSLIQRRQNRNDPALCKSLALISHQRKP